MRARDAGDAGGCGLPPMLDAQEILRRQGKGRRLPAGIGKTMIICRRQKRIGLMESPFEFIKFRTMRDDRDEVGKLLPDEARLSKFGMFLRSSSLDELPQLWSVVTGDMSLIGPRPLLPEYLPLYSKSQKRRHCVKPGITGLAQVMGRNAISWKEKLDLDVYYVDHYDWRLDLKIVWLTVASVVRREGISRNGHATSPPFTGSE